MDPDLARDLTLAGVLGGKRVLVTGASSGIGKEVAVRVAAAGGVPLIVARSEDKLAAVRAEIEAAGGSAHVYRCDLRDPADCDRLVREVLSEHGFIDVLVNNAGHSIRRSVRQSYDRFHDYQRTMSLNYFGALKLILGFLPSMRERRSGHIVNVSSIGVQANIPRFSAYVASKAALDAFSRSVATELVSHGIALTTVYMPLVRTPMIAPTKIYDAFPARTPEQAADMVLDAMVRRPKRISTRLGLFAELAYVASPKLVDRVLNAGYRLFPDSRPKREGEERQRPQPISMEAVAVAHILKGIHW